MFPKQIVDIQLKENLIICERQLSLTRKEAEKQISVLEYSGNGLEKNDKVENAKFPPFVLAFYHFVYIKLRIPSEEEFFNYYCFLCDVHDVDNTFIFNEKTYSFSGLKSRALRSYPSLLRDFHFYILLKESGTFDAVNYSLHSDYCDGTDIALKKGGKEYFLSLHINSFRGNSFKEKKKYRHDYSRINEIVLNVNSKEMMLCGNIWLLTDEHLKSVMQSLQ